MDRFVSEDYFRLGDMPVMVCVLTLSNGGLVVGYSVSRVLDYEDDVARILAKRNAKRQHDAFQRRREANFLLRERA